MSNKTSIEQAKEYCKEKGIELSDENIEKLANAEEISMEELKNITGGCDSPIPKNPKCPLCGSSDTFTGYQSLGRYWAECRTCKHKWTEDLF